MKPEDVELQSDQVELKYGAGGGGARQDGASIGPGGIEIPGQHVGGVLVQQLQSDQVELK